MYPHTHSVVPPGTVPLCVSSARQRLKCKIPERYGNKWKNVNERFITERRIKQFFTRNETSHDSVEEDVIEQVRTMDIFSLTDTVATQLTSPDAMHSHIMIDVMDELLWNIGSAPERCLWNTPVKHPEWDKDFRFLQEIWLSMRALPYTNPPDRYYSPLIPWAERGEKAENQLIADVALRTREVLDPLYLFHVDHVELTPERISVLFFDGILANKSRYMECFSATFCCISAATLLVILLCFVDSRNSQAQLMNLHLAFNWIDPSCFDMLALLMPRTNVIRLSLRGNRLGGGDALVFQEFILQGCVLLEELDISHTSLTVADVCVLIRCIPQLPVMRVLLLDGICVPENKTAALFAAIENSKLTHVSLNGVTPCLGDAYIKRVNAVCESHQLDSAARKTRLLALRGSYFDAFERRSRDFAPRGRATAIHHKYRPFTTNDPSLQTGEPSVDSRFREFRQKLEGDL
ncbi:hypothetical protein ERJ75_000707100 [Trypanosoma vivax]|nr:hypothetical protein ERJ75_000707100 [Trypanosoma vivax]